MQSTAKIISRNFYDKNKNCFKEIEEQTTKWTPTERYAAKKNYSELTV